MMFVEDIKTDFYSAVRGERVLIIVNYDIDAICACKILQTLFKTDNILYTLVPVEVRNDLKTAVQENLMDEKFIVFINCGGTVDLTEELHLQQDITFFVLDSHRPIDICNVYNPGQVRLLCKKEAGIPNFHDIFNDDDDEDEDEDEDNEGGGSENEEGVESEVDEEYAEVFDFEGYMTRRRKAKDASQSRKDKRLWEYRRNRILFSYLRFNYYGRPSALIMFDLAWKLSRDNLDLLWYAIVALTEQLLMHKITEHNYITECGDVQIHIARLSHRNTQKGDDGRNTIRIEFLKDLRLALIRHWTVKSSLTYSMFTAIRLNLWTFQGEMKLHEMLAEIGIPLSQCNQKYAAMDMFYRKDFLQSLENMTGKYSLDGIMFITFLMQHGFRPKYAAMDYVYGLLGLLQSHNDDKPKVDCFLECFEALTPTKNEVLDFGIEMAKEILVAIFKMVRNALETNLIHCAGPFLYLMLHEGNYEPILGKHPYALALLAQFALKAFLATNPDPNNRTLPIVLSMPCLKRIPSSSAMTPAQEDKTYCFVVGAGSIHQENNSNFFGTAFKRASESSLTTIEDVYTNSSVIRINMKDRARFLIALEALLKED